jgi:hypothetical protein
MAIDTAVVALVRPSIFNTVTGISLSVLVLLPNSPSLFRPQHVTVPFAITAHEWESLTLTVFAVFAVVDPSIPGITTGVADDESS